MFKTIVAVVQTDKDIQRVLDVALPLAEDHEAHLVGVHSEALPVPYASAGGFPDTEMIEVNVKIAAERAAHIKAAFLARLERTGISHEFRSFESFAGDSSLSGVDSARCADLVIAARNSSDDSDGFQADVDSLIYEAGRPVLVVPHSGPLLASYARVLIAWNNSKEAARAAFDALPFISQARETRILVVDPVEESGTLSASQLAAALERHGATVTIATRRSGGRHVDEAIRHHIAESGADLLVMGAYSHSWLRELLFGGVTRNVLQSGETAVFLSR
ncbi:universal stress protein [Oryzicola mucosus]|uniref:Universal stress protein n=1 Tax=Oryzicola mucosus TaxID=2767425 RepID=A0A8J6PXN4_9HYPH|nr:universal stress protein [Oryzicola mucosus]MBD0416198.1 universal stress protein [Oryzicola mucosus]